MKTLPRLALIAIILLCGVGCDQVTKVIAHDTLSARAPISMLGDTFRLQYAENSGAMLSIGAGLSDDTRFWIFQIGVMIMLLATLIFTVVSKQLGPWQVGALALVISGGVGNLIDRIWRDGAVIDFLNIGIGSVRTGIFNVADIAIMGGAVFLIIVSLRAEPPPDPTPATSA